MQISNSLRSTYATVRQALSKPEGEGYTGKAARDFTASSLLNDTCIFTENAADVALGVATPLIGGILLNRGEVGTGATLAALGITQVLSGVGNLAGNTVAKLTGSEAAGRTARALGKAGMVVGGMVAIGGSLMGGVAVLACAGAVRGLLDLKLGADYKSKPVSDEAPQGANRLESEAPNLLDSNAPSEFDAPNLLTREADSRASLAELNSEKNPKLLLQTA